MTNLFEELESKKCNAEDLCGGDFRSEDTAVVRLDRIRNAVASAREELKKELCSEKDGETGQPCSDNQDYKCKECRKINEILGEK